MNTRKIGPGPVGGADFYKPPPAPAAYPENPPINNQPVLPPATGQDPIQAVTGNDPNQAVPVPLAPVQHTPDQTALDQYLLDQAWADVVMNFDPVLQKWEIKLYKSLTDPASVQTIWRSTEQEAIDFLQQVKPVQHVVSDVQQYQITWNLSGSLQIVSPGKNAAEVLTQPIVKKAYELLTTLYKRLGEYEGFTGEISEPVILNMGDPEHILK